MTFIIDETKIRDMLGDDSALIKAMLLLFVEDLQQHRAQLQALAPGAWSAYQTLLHRLIGSASYFGSEGLRACLLKAERLSRKQDAQHFPAALAQVYAEIERVLSCELLSHLKTGQQD